MAGVNEELIIRIVPELDKGAVKSVQDQLNAISPKVPIGSAGGGAGGSVVADLKAQQAEMKKVFDGIQQRLIQEDILFRTTRIRLQREIEGIRQQGAQGKITNDQMLQGVAKLESEMVSAADNARNAYQGLAEEIGRTASQFKDVEGVLQSLQAVDKELSVRVVPELDKAAIKSVEDQISAIKPKAPIAVPVSVGGVADMKAQQVEMKKVFDGIQQRLIQEDILLRTTRMRIQREIELTRQQAAQGKITNEQMIQSIAMFEAEAVDAANNARIAYDGLNEELGYTASQFQDVDGVLKQTNRVQTKLLVNTGHLDTGFVTMATSLDKITSQTKNTNLAFMNFGRIIQDAPFGLIGIANNIDPMLNSFSALSNEIDVTTGKMRGFGGAMKALGSQLFGPAGIIFLLGSALPSALLVLQKYQREASKESDALAEAIKRVADEFGRLAGQAAKGKGISQVNAELDTTVKTLDAVRNEQKRINLEIEEQASIQARTLASGQDYAAVRNELVKSAREEKAVELEQLDIAIKSLEANEKNLNNAKIEITAEGVIGRLQRENGIAASLSLEEQYKQRKELTDLEIESLRITDKAQAELLSKQEELRWRMVDLIKDTTIIQTAEGRQLFQALRDEFFSLEKETISSTSEIIDRTNEFIDRTIVQQALLNIQADDNLRIANDENKTIEERISFFNIAMDLQKQETELKIQSVQSQLLLSKDENERLQLNVQLLILSEKLKDIDRDRLKFAKERASEEEKLFLLMQNSALSLREDDRKTIQDRLKNREKILLQREFNIETQMADMAIEIATRKGDTLLALEIQQAEELRLQKKFYIDQEFSEKEAMEMATTEMQTRHAQERADALVAIERTKNQILEEIILNGINAGINLATVAFGKTKAISVAEAIVNTYTAGAQALKIDYGPSPLALPAKIAAMALVISKGMLNVKTILSTKIGSGDGSTHATGGNMTGMMVANGGFLIPRDLATKGVGAMNLAASASPQQSAQEQIFNIDANVDERGIAIAVRRGEQIIRSQQITFV